VPPAWAQGQSCGPKEVLLDWLWQNFKERPIWRGIVNQQSIMVLTESAVGKWSVVTIYQNGTACIMFGGTSAGEIPLEPEERPG
jgi:hypothetical protein